MNSKLIRSLVLVMTIVIGLSCLCNAYATSYPSVFFMSDEAFSDLIIKDTATVGDVYPIRMKWYAAYNNEGYRVAIYNSNGTKVASAEKTWTNSTSITHITLRWDTSGLSAGSYKVVVTKRFYSYYSWHDAPTTSTLNIILISRDQVAANAVVDIINALPVNATLGDKEAVTAARAAYNALTDAQKALVPASVLIKLTTAESQVKAAEDAVAAKAVEDIIAALSDNAGLSDKPAVEAARAAYNALTDAQKALVPASVLTKLIIAESQVKAAQDAVAAKAVEDIIAALSDNARLSDKPAVEAARAAYDALTDAQKALIPADVLTKLTTAESQVKAAEIDAATAKAVADIITGLSDYVGLSDKAAVEAARAAYDALTDAQKALIPADVLAKLTTAESQVKAAEVKAAEMDAAAAKAVADIIAALSDNAGLSDKAAVEAARAAYDALTDAQKALIPADVLTKLTTAESQVKAAEEEAAKTNISDCEITVKDLVYTGKTIKKPSVTVKYDNTNLKEGTDYTFNYDTNAKKIGVYSLTVDGQANYKGSKTVTFKVIPKGTAFTKLTGGDKQITLEWKNPKNITGYQIQYSLNKNFSNAKTVKIKKAKTVKIKKAKTLTTTIKKLNAGSKYYVRIRTYTTIKKKTYYSTWSKTKTVKVKGTASNEQAENILEGMEDMTFLDITEDGDILLPEDIFDELEDIQGDIVLTE